MEPETTRTTLCDDGVCLTLVLGTIDDCEQCLHRRLPQKTDWSMACKIRSDKFDYVLPGAMRDNDIDMWIVIDKGRGTEPMARDFTSPSSNGIRSVRVHGQGRRPHRAGGAGPWTGRDQGLRRLRHPR